MCTGDRVDNAYVVSPRRAKIAANRRFALLTPLTLCVCACVLASAALGSSSHRSTLASGASSRSSHSAPAKHPNGRRSARRRKGKCARRSSLHELGGKVRRRGSSRHAKRGARCGDKHGQRKGARKKHTTKHTTKHKASHSSSCTDADLRPSGEDLERARAATLCLINRERTDRGEQPLQADAHLQQAAQEHSEDMSSHDYFEHVGPRGDTPVERMRATGYIFSSHVGYEIGENIGWGTLWLASPRAMVSSWMQSPGHRANILDAHFRDTGIGISPHPLASLARGQAGATYTQDFGVISGS
jgi:uncharacterized protein YkwD